MPKFSLSLEMGSEATVGNLADALRATADRLERGANRDARLNDVGEVVEFYDIKNPERSVAQKWESVDCASSTHPRPGLDAIVAIGRQVSANIPEWKREGYRAASPAPTQPEGSET